MSARPVRRSRRIVLTSILAAGTLLSAYAAALRQLPTYASAATTPSVTPGCSAGSVEVGSGEELRAKVLQSTDDSIICLTGSFSLNTSASGLVLDDTSVTFEGADPSVTLTPTSANHRLLTANFTGLEDDSLVIRNLTLSGGQYTGAPGTAVHAAGNGSGTDLVVLDGAALTGNSSFTGAALYANDLDTLEVTDSSFTSNAGNKYSGAIDVRGSRFIDISGTEFTGNTAILSFSSRKVYGGAVSIRGASDVAIANSTFTYSDVVPPPEATNSHGYGGAVALLLSDAADDTVIITGSTFGKNYGDESGGAIFAQTDGSLALSATYFLGNEAANGGGIYLDGAREFAVSGSTFIENTADIASGFGGGIRATNDDTVTINASTFTNNRAFIAGGAYSGYTTRLAISASTFTGNYAVIMGGGLRAYQLGTAEITATTFYDNVALDYAGALSAKYIDGLGVLSTTLDSNTAGGAGGADFTYVDDLTLTNVTLTGNSATNPAYPGGALGLFDDTVTMEFVTITGNASASGAGGIYLSNSPLDVTNSIISGNTGTSAVDLYADAGATLTSAYTLFTADDTTSVEGAVVTGGSNIFGLPLLNPLADNGGPTRTMLPLWNSPVIDAGDPAWSPPPATDQRGLPRLDGTRVDIGAVEGHSAQPTPPPPPPTYPPGPPISVLAEPADHQATVMWQPPEASGSFPITNYQVTASNGDGSCLTSTLTCTIKNLTNGTVYSFKVRALNGAGWGPWSDWSPDVIPTATASILITGSRKGQYIYVNGDTTGLVGATVTPWRKLTGQQEFSEGSGIRLIDAQGLFTWKRRTPKRVATVFFSASDNVRSNTITIPAR